jgi:cysteine desulfurase
MRSYLDHAAGSPLRLGVLAEMSAITLEPGNPSSQHTAGRAARAHLEDARERLALALDAHPSEIVFTSGGTEADNIALLGTVRAREATGRLRLAVSAIEHAAVGEAAASLGERAQRVRVPASGVAEPSAWAEALDETCALASLMWVNNETGTRQPIAEVAEIAHAVGAWAHADAVAAFGHVPVSFASSGLDLLSVSAHKLGGPVGVGALVVRRGLELAPLGFGGGQERRLRSGTVPVALAVGLASAAEAAVAELEVEASRLGALRVRISLGLAALPGVGLNSLPDGSPAIVNATFEGCRADDLLLLLDAAGVDCSTGSACTAGVHQPSEVLLAMGRTRAQASGSLRFSLGWSSTDADADVLLAALPDAVARARAANA